VVLFGITSRLMWAWEVAALSPCYLVEVDAIAVIDEAPE
jgi:hypothetical protein